MNRGPQASSPVQLVTLALSSRLTATIASDVIASAR